MPIERFVWTAHAEARRVEHLLDRLAVERAIRSGHAERQINPGDADWLIRGLLVDGGTSKSSTTIPTTATTRRCGSSACGTAESDHNKGILRETMLLHYDPEVDIALISIETGRTVSERHPWGLIDRHPDDGHLMGFEIWRASKTLPAEMIAAMSTASKPHGVVA